MSLCAKNLLGEATAQILKSTPPIVLSCNSYTWLIISLQLLIHFRTSGFSNQCLDDFGSSLHP
jgi:hypothetical protein